MTPKADKAITNKRKLQTNIPYVYTCRNFESTRKPSPVAYEKDYKL